MYECLDCNSKFDYPKEVPQEIFYGVDSEFNYRSNTKIKVCPNCENNGIEEVADEEN